MNTQFTFLTNTPKNGTEHQNLLAKQDSGLFEIQDKAFDARGNDVSNEYVAVYCLQSARLAVLKIMNPQVWK